MFENLWSEARKALAGSSSGEPLFPFNQLIPEEQASTPATSSGMTSRGLSDEAIKNFVNSPLGARLRGSQNIGNLPVGEAMSVLYPPEPPAGGGGLVPPAPLSQPGKALTTPKTSAGVTREQLESAGSRGILPWDFYAQNPEFSGGVAKVGNEISRLDMARRLGNLGFPVPEMSRQEMLAVLQPQTSQINLGGQTDERLKELMDSSGMSYFKMSDADLQKQLHTKGGDLAGKLYTLLEPPKKDNFQNQISGLISQYSEGVVNALNRGDTSMAEYYGTGLTKLMAQFAPMINAQTLAGKAPAEIKALESQAAREQIIPGVPTGQTPGEVTAYRATPGQAPVPFATGMMPSAGHSEQVQATLIANATNKNADRKSKALLAHPSYMVNPMEAMTALQPIFNQWDEETRNEINQIPAIMKSTSGGVVPPQGRAPQVKLTDDQYINMFMTKNPKSDRATATQYLRNARMQHPELF